MLVGIVFSWGQYFANPAYQKDDHRAWGEFLRANVEPGDIVIVNPPHIAELYQYYAGSDVPWVGLPVLNDARPEATGAVLDQLSAQYRNIWLAQSYTPPWGDPDRSVETWLDQMLAKTEERGFHSYASIVRLVRYSTRPPLALAPPPITIPADVLLDGRIQFLGYDAVNSSAQPGRALAFSLYLRRDGQPVNDLKVSLRLLDEAGQLWAQSDRVIAAFEPAGRWRAGMIMREDVNLLIPLATPEGTYHVEAVVYSGATGEPLKPNTPEQISLGQATVARPSAPPPLPSLLSITQRINSCAGPLELIGVNMASQHVYESDTLAVEAFWQARQAPTSEYLVSVQLVNGAGTAVAKKTLPIATGAHGTLTWQQGEIVRGQYTLAMPRNVPAGDYSVRFELDDVAHDVMLPLQACGWRALLPGAAARAIPVTVDERARSFVTPNIAHPMSVTLGTAVTFLGYDVEPQQSAHRLAPSEGITVTVYLQARAAIDADYAIFIHLVDENGRIWGQQDKPAGGVAHPTSRWLPGEVVSTTLTAVVSPLVQVGRLTAIMGLYDPLSTIRLPVAGANPPTDYISLFGLDVVR